MSEINPVSSHGAVSERLAGIRATGQDLAAAPPPREDRVELSDVALLMARIHELPDVRVDVVARIRSEIVAGTYETPQKIDAALDRMHEDLT